MSNASLKHFDCEAWLLQDSNSPGEIVMEKPKVSAREVLADIRRGSINVELMRKYGLSPKRLQSLATKLLKNGLITQADFDRLVT